MLCSPIDSTGKCCLMVSCKQQYSKTLLFHFWFKIAYFNNRETPHLDTLYEKKKKKKLKAVNHNDGVSNQEESISTWTALHFQETNSFIYLSITSANFIQGVNHRNWISSSNLMVKFLIKMKHITFRLCCILLIFKNCFEKNKYIALDSQKK